jgi:hypothetical protein
MTEARIDRDLHSQNGVSVAVADAIGAEAETLAVSGKRCVIDFG